jgi:hypothetical protein
MEATQLHARHLYPRRTRDGNKGFRRTFICEMFVEAMLYSEGSVSILVAHHKL